MCNQERPRILLVDDEPTILSLLSRTLTVTGYQVETAESGERALELAREHQFDFLVTDCLLPGMSGLRLAKLFLEIHPQARVVLMTGHRSWKINAALEREEIIGLVQKPFMPNELQAILDQARSEEKGDQE